MDGKHYCFVQNRSCEYYPCHMGIPEEEFNCLFCFCPLYALGKHCDGQFRYLPSGTKSCEDCLIPHRRACYDWVIAQCDKMPAAAALYDEYHHEGSGE